MIDLHTHTTASDGRCSPSELVARAVASGVTVLAVTDHDTVAGCAEASAAAHGARIDFVSGIEITAVWHGRDIHVLGYFFDPSSSVLAAFLSEQRARRVERVRQMIDRLASLGIALDAEAILRPGLEDPTRSAGRPWIARALVAGGHVKNTNEAFDRWLTAGRPAFVPRVAAEPPEVFERIHAAGGVASIAHPALIGHDEWIPGFAVAGVDALEVYHSKHDVPATTKYQAMTRQLGLAASGGSDFHGDEVHGAAGPGAVTLPLDAFEELRDRADRVRRSRGDRTSV